MRKTILSKMEKQNITQSTLSKKIGASVGVINKFLKQKKEIGFDFVWKILKCVEIKNRNILLSGYIKELTTKKNIKYAMEYFSLHGMHNELGLLIEIANKKDSELKEWARIYSKLQEFQKSLYSNTDPMHVINKLRRLDTEYKETRMVIFLFEMYGFYYLRNFKILHQYLLGLNKEILEVEDAFLRVCFNARVNELMSITELRYNNNPERARYYCDILLEDSITENLDSTAYYTKALSYIFEDLDECVYYYKKSMEYYKRINRQEVIDSILQDIDLAYILWDKKTEFSSEYTRALFEVKNKLKTPESLDTFVTDDREPWIHYFKGLVLEKQFLLFCSFMKFRKRDDFFLANFPKMELVKRGIDLDVINAL